LAGCAVWGRGAARSPEAVPLPPQTRTSDVLSALAAGASDQLTVADVVTVLRGRAFAVLIVLLGLPNCLPMPPPIPLVCGLLLALVAAQIAVGWPTPWLPRSLLVQTIPRQDFSRAVDRALPILRRLERWSRPRLPALDTDPVMRLIGFLLLALSVGILFAAPVIGQIPLGIAVSIVGLGLVERDGVLVLAGFVIGVLGLALSFGFVYAIVAGLEAVF
jgi:hypothetical protein